MLCGIDGLEARAERTEPREEDLESVRGGKGEFRGLDMHKRYEYQNGRDGTFVHQINEMQANVRPEFRLI